ncbi:ABC-type multidrug transport system, ATPase component [Mucilaginibacter gossypiicola]|uniref:ABC-type multidrug transport system, ATPase component n=1 Tax=Mucilaginibacter gossypiicola TaxID=551995 RepID=A0A1H8DSB1_9SPHI|nr:ATP-binding cassette domain-containing protein [Mucilaginibacter gossypiicola]SEN09724.1 ABC-type multidrug transport system, ATPase component [Mucilaginibacter gossypiicola]
MNHILQVDSVELSFNGNKILSDIFIKLQTNQIIGLLGRNGSGKSSLMRVIMGNLKPANGYVAFNGKKYSDAFKYPQLILFLPQFNFIPKALKVARVLEDFDLDYRTFEEEFPESGMRAESKVHSLSGGQRRILEIYVIMKSQSLFAMLDEPFTHLNPLQIENVKTFLLREKETKGIIISDHMYKHVLSISNCLYALSHGKTYPIHSELELFNLGYIPDLN